MKSSFTQPRPSAPQSMYANIQKAMVVFQGMYVTVAQARELAQK